MNNKRNLRAILLRLMCLAILLGALVYLLQVIVRSKPVDNRSDVQIARGMTRPDVIAFHGTPLSTTHGPEGRPIDKFELPDGRNLFVFYDPDTRVSSFLFRNY